MAQVLRYRTADKVTWFRRDASKSTDEVESTNIHSKGMEERIIAAIRKQGQKSDENHAELCQQNKELQAKIDKLTEEAVILNEDNDFFRSEMRRIYSPRKVRLQWLSAAAVASTSLLFSYLKIVDIIYPDVALGVLGLSALFLIMSEVIRRQEGDGGAK